MLVNFTMKNFLSFKNSAEFKMAAGKGTRHSDHVAIVGNGKRILKGGFIFGANASGKSNMVRAIEFAQKIVLNGASAGECYKKYFRIENEYKDVPGVFQFDIYTGGKFYSYGFAIMYQTAQIEGEWLFEIGVGEKCIFMRERDTEGVMRVNSDMIFGDEMVKTHFDVYSADVDNDEMKSKTFLTDMVMRSSKNEEAYQAFRDVRKWFRDLRIVHPNSRFNSINALLENDDERLQLEQLLCFFDTGIETLSSEYRDFDKVFSDLSDDDKALLQQQLINGLSKTNSRVNLSNKEASYDIKLDNGELVASEVVANHGNPADLFGNKDESDGTKRLFDLLPLYKLAINNRVIIIDEIDRSLHSKATIEFITRFYEIAKKSSSQLIATTHDTNIFDLDLIRQDEIWLVERADDHSSALKPLSSYKPRFDKDVAKDYLIGRYGGVPLFSELELLQDYNDESDEG